MTPKETPHPSAATIVIAVWPGNKKGAATDHFSFFATLDDVIGRPEISHPSEVVSFTKNGQWENYGHQIPLSPLPSSTKKEVWISARSQTTPMS